MTASVQQKTNAELLVEIAALPEHVTGEVFAGELWLTLPSSRAHQRAVGEVTCDLTRGSARGWVIDMKIEVKFPNEELAVPDISGWREERISGHEEDNPVTVAPDWCAEVLSDSTRYKDLGVKKRLYASQGIKHLWLIDPVIKWFEAYELREGRWLVLGTWGREDVVTGLAPFPELTFELSRWWLK